MRILRHAAAFTGAAVLITTPIAAFAATTPDVGSVATYAILAATYTNAVPGTTINGDIGFTTAPAIIPGGTHANVGPGAAFATASTDAGTLLNALNAQPCTFTFAAGPIDLATDSSHGTVGVYTPGVYCVATMSPDVKISAPGITLSGNGTYIFRFNRPLTTAASSTVHLADGASACDVFWTLIDNAIISTLGADSVFTGTVIDTTALTLRSNVSWTGRAILLNGILTTVVDDTITTPSACTPPVPPEPPAPPITTESTTTVTTTVPPATGDPVPVVTTVVTGAPNTGAGGDSARTLFILALSGLLAISSALFLVRQSSKSN